MVTTYNIGYIDEDINQVDKYRRRFEEFGFNIIGYNFFQGMTLDQLMDQVYESDIDLLMIDYKLDESNKVTFNGEKVEEELYDKKPLFPHIIFTNKRDDAENHVEDWKIIFEKDEIPNKNDEIYDEDRTERFIKTLTNSITKYKKRIENIKFQISELLEQGESVGLNAAEKSKLIDLQENLSILDKTRKSEVPKQFISHQTLENLSKSRKEAEAFLESLIKNNKK